MLKRKKSKIKQRLIVGFMTICALYVLFGVLAIFQLNTLSKMARTIHNHSLEVSNAALTAKASVTKLHCEVMDILHMTSFKGIETLLSEINRYENEVIAALDIVRERIIGVRGQELEAETRDLFFNWESIRWEIMTRIGDQRRKEALALIHGKGRDQLRLMENKAQELSNYSRATARELFFHSETMNRRMIIITIIILVLSVPFVLVVAYFTIRSVLSSERSIRESEERYALSQRIGRLGLFEWNIRDDSVYLADETKAILGIKSDEIQWTSPQIIQSIHPEDRPVWKKELKACRKEGREFKMDIRARRPGNGHDLWLSVLGEFSQAHGDRAGRFLGVVMDITERKDSEQRHNDLEKQLIQSQKMEAIGRLAGGVAHDFNNLLSIILGYSEMLMEDIPYDHPFHSSLSEVHDAALRAQGVTRQLLAFGRKQVLEIKKLDINQVIMNFEKLLRRAVTEDIVLQTFLTQEPALVKADNAQIEQVLMNLVVNARDAMPNGGELSIETSVVDLSKQDISGKMEGAPGRYVMITVSDTGEGIEPDFQDKIFEPFFTTKGEDKGTGLGLATVYGIVTQHGGFIMPYTEKGHGTTFKIYLPLSMAPGRSSARYVQASSHSDNSSATVLVVEDDEALAKLAYRLLEKHEFQVIPSGSTQDAVSRAEQYEGAIDLLLTDVIMPGMKGPEVYEKIRAFHPKIRVLYMSGYTGDVITRHGVLKDNIHFLQKPFSKQMLLEKINEALNSP